MWVVYNMIWMITCYDPKMFQYLCGMEKTPSYRGVPCLSLLCETGHETADLYYRLYSMMLSLNVPMWVEGNMIHFDLYFADTILTVMGYMSSYLRIADQQSVMVDGILYSTILWKIPVRI